MEQQWLDSAIDIDQNTVDQESVGYPFIQWVNGNKTLKQLGGVPYTGGWALPCANIDVDALPGWTRGSLEHGETETDVWFCRDITVAVIRSRKAWQVRSVDGTTHIMGWDQYDAAKAFGQPRGKLQMLCMIHNIDALTYGPFMLTLRGSYARAVTDTVLPTFAKTVLAPANALNLRRKIKAKFPTRAFWMTIGPDRDEAGAPRFTPVGKAPTVQSVVLPIMLGVIEKPTPEQLGKRFVGSDLITLGTTLYMEAEQWATAFAQPTTTAEVVSDAAPIAEEETPF